MRLERQKETKITLAELLHNKDNQVIQTSLISSNNM